MVNYAKNWSDFLFLRFDFWLSSRNMFTMAKKKTRYTDSELKDFEKIINEKLTEAEEQLEFYMTQIKSVGEDGDGKLKGLDNSNASTDNERLITLAGRTRKHIQHLKNAKMRVENKVYGICRETGNLISKARLKAVPHATLSIQAKQNRK